MLATILSNMILELMSMTVSGFLSFSIANVYDCYSSTYNFKDSTVLTASELECFFLLSLFTALLLYIIYEKNWVTSSMYISVS